MRADFCVYEHWRPDKNECFYVGKGTNRRAKWIKRPENSHHTHIVSKLANKGLAVEIKIIANGLTEDAAFTLERERIALWRASGSRLANMTQGGEGASGVKLSPEHKAAFSLARKGKKNSKSHNEALRLANLGRKLSEETRAKIGEKSKGRVQSEESRRRKSASLLATMSRDEVKDKMRVAARRRAESAETRKKISEALIGKKRPPRTAEHREKLAKAKLGARHSEETRAKMRASHALRKASFRN